ncbi:MAG: ABC transporter permease [Anaerolineales bacterium]|nr:MAG: ABC transporter permease [Anaerolineales bacterium]
MSQEMIIIGLAGIFASAAPLIFAVVGETISERAGVINLSINGTILLSAMGGFAVAYTTNNIVLGFLAGMLIGALVSLIVAFSSITLHQSQVAVGFVLALTCRDLSYFLGNPYMGVPGPRLQAVPIPYLSELPILGQLFFRHDVITYLSFVTIIFAWIWIFRTRAGLMLQGIGEKPAAAYIRGANVNLMRYVYTIIGGALIGLAGPAFSLAIRAGWMGTISGLDGFGWIALAITIFGGWNPLRGAFGAYLFAFLQWLGLVLQPVLTQVPSQVLQVAPFPLMILTLLLVNIGNAEWVERTLAAMPESVRKVLAKLLRAMRTNPPAALGVPFERD